jgi:hypothetical protein
VRQSSFRVTRAKGCRGDPLGRLKVFLRSLDSLLRQTRLLYKGAIEIVGGEPSDRLTAINEMVIFPQD